MRHKPGEWPTRLTRYKVGPGDASLHQSLNNTHHVAEYPKCRRIPSGSQKEGEAAGSQDIAPAKDDPQQHSQVLRGIRTASLRALGEEDKIWELRRLFLTRPDTLSHRELRVHASVGTANTAQTKYYPLPNVYTPATIATLWKKSAETG
jgi:hypothetical protein